MAVATDLSYDLHPAWCSGLLLAALDALVPNRRRPVEALMVLLVIAAAATTLTV
jgi:hypothetical protein